AVCPSDQPCSKQVSESSSDSSPLSSRSTSCCSSARDCSKSRATFLRAMAEPVLCGGSETVATLAELGGKSSGQGQAARIKTLKGRHRCRGAHAGHGRHQEGSMCSGRAPGLSLLGTLIDHREHLLPHLLGLRLELFGAFLELCLDPFAVVGYPGDLALDLGIAGADLQQALGETVVLEQHLVLVTPAGRERRHALGQRADQAMEAAAQGAAADAENALDLQRALFLDHRDAAD